MCDHAAPPDKPQNAAGGDGFTLVQAIHTFDFGDPSDGGAPSFPSIGFDLDQRCSSTLDPPLCHPPSWSDGGVTDGVNGIDNATGALLYSENQVFNSSPLSSAFLSSETDKGLFAPLVVFRVLGYNGFHDDDQVRVELLVPMPPTSPKWDGTDVLLVDPVSATVGPGDGGDAIVARFADDHAYVAGYQLVAHLEGGAMKLANTIFVLTDAVLSAHLQPVGGARFAMQGLLAGHSRTDDLLSILPQLTKTFPGFPVCEGNDVYRQLKTWLCGHADSLSSGDSPGGPCTAMSFGVRFDTAFVDLGGVASPPDGGPLCEAGTDPASDTCLTPPQ
jgi:hypothetical protein